MCKDGAAHKQDHEHDGQLIEGVQHNGKDLC